MSADPSGAALPDEFEELVARINAAQVANYRGFEGEPGLALGELKRSRDEKFLREFETSRSGAKSPPIAPRSPSSPE